jgi:hypothetical protein
MSIVPPITQVPRSTLGMTALSFLLLFAACATSPPTVARAPAWDMIPPGVTDLLCSRLQMDALATGTVAAVRVTQPLVNAESIAALRSSVSSPKAVGHRVVPQLINRAIPIAFGTRCAWKPLDVFDPRPNDEMVVELSAPIVNPVIPSEAGIFVRVTLGRENASWYWIALVPKDNQWGARWVYVLAH